MITYIAVLYFTVYGYDVRALPPGPITEFRAKASCERTLPKVAAKAAQNAPAWVPKPKAVACEPVHKAKVIKRSAKNKVKVIPPPSMRPPPKDPVKAKRWWQW